MDIPYNSDLVLQSAMNRDLIERHPRTLRLPLHEFSKAQEPVYGFRYLSRQVNQADIAVAAEQVDKVFAAIVRDSVDLLENL